MKIFKKLDKETLRKILRVVRVIALIAFLGGILSTGSIAIANAVHGKKLLTFANSFEKVSYTNQLIPQLDSDGYYYFATDAELKVLQLTDLHIGGGSSVSVRTDKNTLNAVAAMISYEKPDLVIITGDMTYTVFGQTASFNNKRAIASLVALLETLGVYWTCTFGNHDSESYYCLRDREKIADFYIKHKHCILQKGPTDIAGFGNTIIKIKNSDGLITRALVTIDSLDYAKSGGYANITEGQTKWYEQEMNKLHQDNISLWDSLSSETKLKYEDDYNPNIPSALYFHIPTIEYKDAWDEWLDNGTESELVEYYYGVQEEDVCHGSGQDNLFDTMVKVGGDSMFCGHDHINNYSVDYKKEVDQKPIRLTYGMSIDYLAYWFMRIDKVGEQRGCTVIKYDGGDFEISPQNYYQKHYKTQFRPKEKVSIDKDKLPDGDQNIEENYFK